jgi:hypothetical protein
MFFNKTQTLVLLSLSALLAIASACIPIQSPFPQRYCVNGIQPEENSTFIPCDTYYTYGDGSSDVSRDMITDLALSEEQLLNAQAQHFSHKFELSEPQGMRLAKLVNEFGTVRERSEADLADFASRLYGVSPRRILSAVSRAQLGEVSEMNEVVADAAGKFETTPGNMRKIIKTLHGNLLHQQGIQLD